MNKSIDDIMEDVQARADYLINNGGQDHIEELSMLQVVLDAHRVAKNRGNIELPKGFKKAGISTVITITPMTADNGSGFMVGCNIPKNPQTVEQIAGAMAVQLLEDGVPKFVVKVLPKILKDAGIDVNKAIAELDEIMSQRGPKPAKGNSTIH
jgi:hypothetical protein